MAETVSSRSLRVAGEERTNSRDLRPLDAEFPEGHLPDIHNALVIEVGAGDERIQLTSEVQQHLGGAAELGLPRGLQGQ